MKCRVHWINGGKVEHAAEFARRQPIDRQGWSGGRFHYRDGKCEELCCENASAIWPNRELRDELYTHIVICHAILQAVSGTPFWFETLSFIEMSQRCFDHFWFFVFEKCWKWKLKEVYMWGTCSSLTGGHGDLQMRMADFGEKWLSGHHPMWWCCIQMVALCTKWLSWEESSEICL